MEYSREPEVLYLRAVIVDALDERSTALLEKWSVDGHQVCGHISKLTPGPLLRHVRSSRFSRPRSSTSRGHLASISLEAAAFGVAIGVAEAERASARLIRVAVLKCMVGRFGVAVNQMYGI